MAVTATVVLPAVTAAKVVVTAAQVAIVPASVALVRTGEIVPAVMATALTVAIAQNAAIVATAVRHAPVVHSAPRQPTSGAQMRRLAPCKPLLRRRKTYNSRPKASCA